LSISVVEIINNENITEILKLLSHTVLKFAQISLFLFFLKCQKCKNMPGIFRKCPYCGEDAILKTIEPDFRKGVFRRIFECRNGHEFSEKNSFEEEEK